MGMVYADDETEESETKTFEEQCAHQLLNAVRRIGKRPQGKIVKFAQWCYKFQQLKDNGHSENEIRSVLHWYCENIKLEYVPKAYSAGTFRDKFARIKKLMDQQLKAHQYDRDKLTPECLALLIRVEDWQWPASIAEALPQIIEESLTNYHAFIKVFNRISLEEADKNPTIRRLADHLLEVGLMCDNSHFIQHWMTTMNERISKFTFVRPDTIIFTPTHDAFHQMGSAWTYAYSRRSHDWYRMMDLVLKAMEKTK